MEYLLGALILMAGLYLYYRLNFLKKNKKSETKKPHFTLKIETDS